MKEKSTRCVHAGTIKDAATKGVNTPIYTSTAYAYLDQPQQFYPRYFNVHNQQAVIEKLCVLEGAESGLVFSSGMAVITTTLLAHLQAGDHIVFSSRQRRENRAWLESLMCASAGEQQWVVPLSVLWSGSRPGFTKTPS